VRIIKRSGDILTILTIFVNGRTFLSTTTVSTVFEMFSKVRNDICVGDKGHHGPTNASSNVSGKILRRRNITIFPFEFDVTAIV